MRRVFISSTVNDLKEYREAARNACQSMGLAPVMMQDFEAMSAGATEGSLKKLADCDLYVGIFAHRYGYCEDGHDGKSVTEVEFDTAARDNIDRLCFVVEPTYTGLDAFREKDKEAELKALKDKVQKLVVRFFTTPDDFKASLTISLRAWLDTHRVSGGLDARLVTDPDDVPGRPRKLIGRDQMLADGLEALKSDQPLLLHGFAGMGKTALAAEMAAEWAEAYKQPVLWLRIGSQSFEVNAEALARPFGAQTAVTSAQDDDSKVAALRTILKASGTGLIVLDDAWNGEALAGLLKAMPRGIAVMVTSRRRFAVGDLIEVGRLAGADALALLAYHAGASAVTDAKAQELVKLLGYHAFSVEVAGRTMKVRRWTPAEMIAQIKETPHESSMPADFGEADRHSIKELLDTSIYALPDEKTTRVFLAFGALFAPQATPEMLGLLTGISTQEAENALITLDDHGLAERIPADGDKNVAYYRIHDLAASYARAQGSDDQREAAVDACLEYLGRNQEPGHASFAALRPELDNLLGAAGRALTLGRLEDCEEFGQGLYVGGSQILDLQGYSGQAVVLLGQVVEAARLREDRQAEGSNLNHLGIAHFDLGQVEKATSYYEPALAIAREIGNRHGEGQVLGNMGNAYYSLGEVERAIRFFEQALAIEREMGDRLGEGITLGNLGNAYSDLGEVEKAIRFYEQELAITREIGDRRGEGGCLGNLGSAYSSLGQVEEAVGIFEQALVIAREIGDRGSESQALNNMGNAYANLGQVEEAVGFFKQVLVIAREIGDRRSEGVCLSNLASAYTNMGQVEEAIGFFEQALVIVREIGDRHSEGQVLGNLGNACASLGQIEKAVSLHEQNMAIAREIGDRRGEGTALLNMGNVQYHLGQAGKAIDFYEQALVIARETGNQLGEGNVLRNLGVVYASCGDLNRTLEYFRQVRTIYIDLGAQHLINQIDGNIRTIEGMLKGG